MALGTFIFHPSVLPGRKLGFYFGSQKGYKTTVDSNNLYKNYSIWLTNKVESFFHGDYKTKFTTGHQTTALPNRVPWQTGPWECLLPCRTFMGECTICSFPRGSHRFPRKDDSLWESADRTIEKMESHSDKKAAILLCTVMMIEEQIQRKVHSSWWAENNRLKEGLEEATANELWNSSK